MISKSNINVKLFFKILIVINLFFLPSTTYPQNIEIKSLWDKAKNETLKENYNVACDLYHQIINYKPADTAYIVMSQIWLANIYGNTKDLKNMDLMIAALEEYVQSHPENDKLNSQLTSIKTFRHTLDKSAKTFEEDLDGTWISDWAYEGNQQPYLILCIGNQEAHISPYSKFAENNGFYRLYKKQFVSQKKATNTKDITIKGNENYGAGKLT